MNAKKLLTVFVFITVAFIVASNIAAFPITELLTISKSVLAQVPPAPSPPSGGDLTTDNQLPDTNSQLQQQPQSITPTGVPPPTIQITSHSDGSQVPVGELTIQGKSSDNQERNCQVYADVNDITPLQNATAAGANGDGDYSQWTFTYTQDYQPITQGVNELTAKISCFDNGGSATVPVSEWHSVNITGVTSGATLIPTPTPKPTPTPSPTMTQTPATTEALDAGQGASFPSSSVISPSVPPTTLGETSEDVSQGLAEGSGRSLEGGDDEGDDDGGEGDDDGGEGDDDGGEGDDG
jgi:hypothetical protein